MLQESRLTDHRDAVNINKDPFLPLIEGLSGKRLQGKLIILAHQYGGVRIAGTEKLPERYAVDRVALSPMDISSRRYIAEQMNDAGMSAEYHPLGVMGTYAGEENVTPVLIVSHTDSVSRGGMYDGAYGVISGIEVVRVLHQDGIRLRRPICVLSLTGEESAGFNRGLFGSAGMFQGLTEKDLNSLRPGGITIRQALEDAGYDPETVTTPAFRAGAFHAAVELHIEQNTRLDRKGENLAVIEAVAAPDRYEITIGDRLTSDEQKYEHASFLRIDVAGVSGHSGATPMGREHRADGFVAVADTLLAIEVLRRKNAKEGRNIQISVGGLAIDNQSINKIPGTTSMEIRICGTTPQEIDDTTSQLQQYVSTRNIQLTRKPSGYPDFPLSLRSVDASEVSTRYYQPEQVMDRHILAARIVEAVHGVANEYRDSNVVGTVGTYNNSEGQIVLGVDTRGIDLVRRNEAVNKLMGMLPFLVKRQGDPYYSVKNLAGSGEPVQLDRRLVTLASQLIDYYQVGSHVVDYSPAGHDVQNVARAGIPTVMIFIPSRNNGMSHNPDEYSTPEDLEKGVRALAALVYTLASESE